MRIKAYKDAQLKLFLPAVFFLVHFVQYRHVPGRNKKHINSQYLCGKFYEKVTKSIGHHRWREFPMATESRILYKLFFPLLRCTEQVQKLFIIAPFRGLASAAVRSEDGRTHCRQNEQKESKQKALQESVYT